MEIGLTRIGKVQIGKPVKEYSLNQLKWIRGKLPLTKVVYEQYPH
jgi:hypothetical protein